MLMTANKFIIVWSKQCFRPHRRNPAIVRPFTFSWCYEVDKERSTKINGKFVTVEDARRRLHELVDKGCEVWPSTSEWMTRTEWLHGTDRDDLSNE